METITVDRLKPAQLDLDGPVEVAQSRPRGRPKDSSSHQASGPVQVKQPSGTTNLPRLTGSGRIVNWTLRYIPFWGGGWCSGLD